MRTKLRGKLTLLFMTLGMLLALPAVAFAADVVSDVNADLSSSVSTPTWVGPNADKSFQIKVWAVGNYNNINNAGRTGEVQVVKNYSTTFDTATNQWKIVAGTGASDKETFNFETGLTNAGIDLATISGNDYHYTTDCPTTGTVPMGCAANPFVVSGKLSVGNVPDGTAMSLTDAFGTAAPGFTVNSNSVDSGFVKVDAAKPTVTLTTPANNAEYDLGESVSANYSCEDSGSGLKATGGCVGTVANGSAIDTSSTGSKSFTVTATDNVGNVETVTHNYAVVNPDSVAPTSSHQLSQAANANGWHNQDVTVTLDATDNTGGSGVKEVRYSTNGGANAVYDSANKPVISTEGTTTFSYFAVDNNNNSESPHSFDIKLDKTAPEVAYKSASPNANANGWRNQDVTATFEATDSLSGMGATDAEKTATDTATTTGEGTNVSVDSPAFTDRAGNTAAAGTATSPDFKIDKTKPTVSVTGVSNGATYTTGNAPTPGCDTQDQPGLSGVKTNATVNVTGGTGGFGTLTATCSGAEDNADNAGDPKSVTYSVKAAFNGFLQPIDGHSVNTGKYGRTYPIKWQLRDNSGALISDSAAQLLVGTMTGGQKAVSCTSFDLSDSDALEESTTGNTALRYDTTSDQFIYNYKAPTSGTCYVFAIRNADGLTTQQIDFKFTK